MKKLWKWLYWNSANLLSASRCFSILIPIDPWDWSIKTTFMIILLLGFTDFLDGIIAREIGNFRGKGMAIDAGADKVMVFSVSIWILLKMKNIDPKIIEMIIWGEALPFSIGIIGIGLAWKKNQCRRLSEIAEAVWERWKINIPGKMTMVFYFIMAGFIYLDVTFPRNEIFFHFYIVSFGVGFIFRVISIGYYVIDLNNWQKEYNSAV